MVAWAWREARDPAGPVETAAIRSPSPGPGSTPGRWLNQPIVVVESFGFPDGDAEARAAAEQGAAQLRDALARFERITVLATDDRIDSFDAAVSLSARVPDYRIQGRFMRQGPRGLSFSGRIVDGEGRVLTTRSFVAPNQPFGPDIADWLDEFMAVSATRIASPFGILASEEWRRRRGKAAREDDPFICTLMIFQHWREEDPQLFSRAVRCLTRVIEHDPTNAPVLALLAEAEVMAWRHGRGFGEDAPSTLRALARARRAVELAPNASFAQLALCSALQTVVDRAGAMSRCRQALALNPNDAYVLASAGFYFVKQGLKEEGVRLLAEERLGNLAMPTWVHGARALAAYLSGDVVRSQAELSAAGASTVFVNRLLKVVLETRGASPDIARDIWERLPADFRSAPREGLLRRGYAPETIMAFEPYLQR